MKSQIDNLKIDDTTSGTLLQQNLENLPDEILSQARFIPVGNDKAPLIKKWSDPKNQKFYSDIQGLAGFDTTGHGKAADYLFLDFDHVLNDNGEFVTIEAEKWFNRIADKLKSYCELSASRHGLHILAKPTTDKFKKKIAGGEKNGRIYFSEDKTAFLEIFYKTSGRHCLFTGHVYRCAPKAKITHGAPADIVFQELLDTIIARNKKDHKNPSKKNSALVQRKDFDVLGSDYDLFRIDIMLDTTPAAELGDNDWLAVISACKNLGVPENRVDIWCQHDPKRYNAEENQKRWNSITDDSFGIETLHGIAKRFNYSEENTRRLWYQQQDITQKIIHSSEPSDKKMIKYDEITTRAGVLDCPVDLILPHNYIFDKDGITLVVPPKKEGGEPKYICAARTPIIPTKKFRDPDKGTVEYEVAIKSGKTWRKTEVDGRTLLDPRAILNLANYDALIKEPKILCSFFADIIHANPDSIPEIKAYNKTGWTNSDCEEFVYPTSNDDYICRRPGYDYVEIFKPKGDPEKWKETFEEVSKHGGAIAHVTIGGALAALLVRPLGLPNLQLHIEGKRGIGKSALPEFAASIYGDPSAGALTRTFSSTLKNRLEIATAFCDLPCILDELETLSKREIENLPQSIYEYSLGVANQAQRRNGEARETKRFFGARLSTGEHAIMRQQDNAGIYKRVLNLRCSKLFEDDFAFNLHNFCKRNRGLFGERWIQYIVKNLDTIQDHFFSAVKQIKSHYADFDPTQLKTLAVSLVAYQHFKICIGLQDNGDDHKLFADCDAVIKLLPTSAEIDDSKRAIDFLSSYVAGHTKFFAREVDNPEFNNEYGQNTPECYGKIFSNGEVAFLPHALKNILEKDGGFLSAGKLIAEFCDKKYLRHAEGERTSRIRIDGKVQRVYYFVTGFITENTIHSDDTVLEECAS